MLSRRRALGTVVLLFALAAIAIADQPNMRAARTDLQQARAQLQAALANKGGHRQKAIQHVNNAISYVNSGIAYDRRHNHAQRLLGEVFNTSAAPDQPHMQAALDHLRQAKTNLENATSDKGGFRRKAIAEVNDAIDETKKGIDAGE
jgi:multidrug resistance efflux pump